MHWYFCLSTIIVPSIILIFSFEYSKDPEDSIIKKKKIQKKTLF